MIATGFYNTSDIRLKEVINVVGDMILFKWKDGRDNFLHYGYGAQNMVNLYPNQVGQGETWSVNYIEVLVKKVNDLEQKIIELEKRLL
jgi:hypothetical protein